jgi:hypothetical protein
MTMAALLFAGLNQYLPWMYTSDIAVINIAAQLLIIAGLFQLFAEEFVKNSGKKSAEMVFDSINAINPLAWLKALQQKAPNTETTHD